METPTKKTPEAQAEKNIEAPQKKTNEQHVATLKSAVDDAINNARSAGLEVYDVVTLLNATAKKLETQNPESFNKA